MELNRTTFLTLVEHTLLSPTADRAAVDSFLAEAVKLGVGGVCISPCWLSMAATRLEGTGIRLVSVCGFPAGTATPKAKAAEAEDLVAIGAAEVDMVVSVGYVKSGMDDAVRDEIAGVVAAAAPAAVKVIVEAAALTDEEKIRCAKLCREAGAAFVKTSTGFGPGGATPEDVRLLASASGLPVKAAGGIRTWEQVTALVDAGATRLGMSRTAQILNAFETIRA